MPLVIMINSTITSEAKPCRSAIDIRNEKGPIESSDLAKLLSIHDSDDNKALLIHSLVVKENRTIDRKEVINTILYLEGKIITFQLPNLQ